ncbi:hypothetical protein GGR33_000731 [Methylobacterium brachythecii]|uniref:Uncharacterized protein n=1 Tax=Methylobacterium brachythecii TaxID=1176177 RepID=A0A7W6F5U6_9HYPH|nr:hypothetical protein [Methylobacterium brachythecii]
MAVGYIEWMDARNNQVEQRNGDHPPFDATGRRCGTVGKPLRRPITENSGRLVPRSRSVTVASAAEIITRKPKDEWT